mmetsp:Transcript_11093/g.16640  ORF Transcript_11093/g.16640 Transcript_11093/m.16640 type:complete len:236 (+) Transcript_11093:59-766(+)
MHPFGYVAIHCIELSEHVNDEGDTFLVAEYEGVEKHCSRWDRDILRFACKEKTKITIRILRRSAKLGEGILDFRNVAAGKLKYEEFRHPLVHGGHVKLGLTFDLCASPLSPGDEICWTGYFTPLANVPVSGLKVVDVALDFVLVSYNHFGAECTLPVPRSAVAVLSSTSSKESKKGSLVERVEWHSDSRIVEVDTITPTANCAKKQQKQTEEKNNKRNNSCSLLGVPVHELILLS